jgi:tetratricopeptide (TPR) repeat protein
MKGKFMVVKANMKLHALLVFTMVMMSSVLIIGNALADTEKAKEHYNTGIQEAQAGNTDAAIVAYKAAIATDADYVDAYINLGAIYFQQKDYQKALDTYATATEKDPQNSAALANLGRVQLKLKKYAEAEASFKTAIGIDSTNADLYKELGKAYFYKKDYAKLIETLTKCHEMGGGDHLSYYMLGKGYQKTNKTTNAVAGFKRRHTTMRWRLSPVILKITLVTFRCGTTSLSWPRKTRKPRRAWPTLSSMSKN